MKAPDFCERAAALMRERGKQYDKPEGERSMARTVAAFNAVTGRDLTEPEGWLLMLLLKQVRQWQQPGKYHADSAEDGVAYSALLAEALAAQPSTVTVQDCYVSEPQTGFAVPPAAPEKLPLLPLVVGGVYRNRKGDEVELTAGNADGPWPFIAARGAYAATGGWRTDGVADRRDLVERIR